MEPEVTLPWLVRLRWLFLAGWAVMLGLVWHWQLHVSWPLLLGVAGIGGLSNVVLHRSLRRARPAASAWIIGSVLVLDTVLLTVLLAASGGPMNPFTVLFLVDITLSAVVLSARWTALVAALSIVGFGALFVLPLPQVMPAETMAHGQHGFDRHLQGMWAAFVLASLLTAFFVGRISRAISAQREQIASLRESSARNARLAALTTLAAGAAHELNSPLGTIAVAAHEAKLRCETLPGAGVVLDDIQLIQLEVDRCQEVLHQMSARAAADGGAAELFDIAELERRVRQQLSESQAAVVRVTVPAPLRVVVPGEPLVSAVVALVKNALEASGDGQVVDVGCAVDGDALVVSVVDRGPGIAPEILPRVGEPFFTTKPPGRGMGLGVFLARAFAESHGGGLEIDSAPGRGTSAVVRVPYQSAENPA